MGDESKNEESLDAGESSRKGGKQDRSSSAKAFYRAMYAGAEPDPEDYGMGTKEEPQRSGPCPNCTRIQQDMEALEKRTLEAENHYKRMAADFENYRKRVAREKEEFSANGIQRAIEAILPALDDMDMAKTKLSADMDAKAMMDSLNMVYNRFNRCLEQIGIKQLAVIGEMFDPVYHEPVQQVPSKAVPDGAVVHQLRPGYMFGDKVLRPSLVNVATSDGAEDIEETPAQAEEVASDVQDDEGEPGSRTQDLPIVDVTADLEAKVFEDKDEEGNE